MKSRWSDRGAAEALERWGHRGEELALRTYSSRLIGADRELVLHGGGNTSVKTSVRGLLGETIEVLQVKGSGWDLGSIEPDGFPSVDLEYLLRMRSLTALSDEDMVNALRTHLLDASAPNPSIETLLHAFLPHRFVDHSHADVILALTNLSDGAKVVREALGDDVALVPYVKPGYDLSVAAAEAHDAHPGCVGLVLLQHGLFSFGATAEESYHRHIELVTRGERYLQKRRGRGATVIVSSPDAVDAARRGAAALAPTLRGALADETGRWVLDHRVDEALLAFVDDPALEEHAASGPLTPDHVIRTKRDPLVVRDPSRAAIDEAVHRYHERYDAYFAAQAKGQVRLDRTPRVVLAPGVGLFGVGRNPKEARIAADIYESTARTKRSARLLGPYKGLSDRDLFDMEYWSLEQAKLGKRRPPALDRQVALITGAGGPIGFGVARVLLGEGAAVVVTDVDAERLERVRERLGGGERVLALRCDVTDVGSVRSAFEAACGRFGGVDIVVPNAGVAHVAPIEGIDPAAFRRAIDVNLVGTWHTLAEAARVFRAQGTGGHVVVVSTKNVMAPGASFGAYSATKAAAHQLARVAALELAPDGVSVNLVAPDAVFAEGDVSSGLWAAVGPERARSKGLSEDELQEHYRRRNLLGATITGEHVGRAVRYFVTDQSPTTGAVLPVDGGVAGAFPR